MTARQGTGANHQGTGEQRQGADDPNPHLTSDQWHILGRIAKADGLGLSTRAATKRGTAVTAALLGHGMIYVCGMKCRHFLIAIKGARALAAHRLARGIRYTATIDTEGTR